MSCFQSSSPYTQTKSLVIATDRDLKKTLTPRLPTACLSHNMEMGSKRRPNSAWFYWESWSVSIWEGILTAVHLALIESIFTISILVELPQRRARKKLIIKQATLYHSNPILKHLQSHSKTKGRLHHLKTLHDSFELLPECDASCFNLNFGIELYGSYCPRHHTDLKFKKASYWNKGPLRNILHEINKLFIVSMCVRQNGWGCGDRIGHEYNWITIWYVWYNFIPFSQ